MSMGVLYVLWTAISTFSPVQFYRQGWLKLVDMPVTIDQNMTLGDREMPPRGHRQRRRRHLCRRDRHHPYYPRLTSSSPALLPLPTHLVPSFTPLGATVPLPPSLGSSKHRHQHPKEGPQSSPGGRHPRPHPTTGHRPMFPRSPTRQRRPGVLFTNYVLTNFHLLRVPGCNKDKHSTKASFWITGGVPGKPPSLAQVASTLDFCFSTPPSLCCAFG